MTLKRACELLKIWFPGSDYAYRKRLALKFFGVKAGRKKLPENIAASRLKRADKKAQEVARFFR